MKVIEKKKIDSKKNKQLKTKKNSTTNKSGNNSYRNLTIQEIENELKREKYKLKYKQVLMSTIYILIIVASVAAIVATLLMPVLQITGSSMNPTLFEGEIVLAIKEQNLESGDIIAFYHGNKILIKRVIAGPGNWININKDGDVFINDILLEEKYIKNKSFGESDLIYPYQVPEETYFILGDDRENSVDSRSYEIGTISKDDVIGKIVFKIWPFNKIGVVNK